VSFIFHFYSYEQQRYKHTLNYSHYAADKYEIIRSIVKDWGEMSNT